MVSCFFYKCVHCANLQYPLFCFFFVKLILVLYCSQWIEIEHSDCSRCLTAPPTIYRYVYPTRMVNSAYFEGLVRIVVYNIVAVRRTTGCGTCRCVTRRAASVAAASAGLQRSEDTDRRQRLVASRSSSTTCSRRSSPNS